MNTYLIHARAIPRCFSSVSINVPCTFVLHQNLIMCALWEVNTYPLTHNIFMVSKELNPLSMQTLTCLKYV